MSARPQGDAERRDRRRSLIDRLCTLHLFDPKDLDGITDKELDQALGRDADRVTRNGKQLSCLRSESRIEGLQSFESAGAALNARPPIPTIDTPLQRVLTEMLEWASRGSESPAPSLAFGAASDEISRVLYWLEGVPGWGKEFARRVRGSLWRQERKAVLEQMGGKQFIGRTDELRELQSFVDGQKGTMVLDAVGGMGKTALLAKFQLQQTDRTLVIALDLDDPQIDIRTPSSLFAAMFAILTKYIPEFQSDVDGLSSIAFNEYDGETSRQLAEFENILKKGRDRLGRARGAVFDDVIVILDTFERAIRLDEDASLSALEEVDKLFGSVKMNLIIAGRGVASVQLEQRRPPLHLKELSKSESRTMLTALEVHANVIDTLLELVPRRPLTLRLVARLPEVKSGTVDLKRLDDAVRRQLVDGYLHLRLLAHNRDPRVAALFQIGFVLRRISPELILSVLRNIPIPPVNDIEDAKLLFANLARISDLVKEGDSKTELVLRNEIREELVGLMSENERQLVTALRRDCIKHFQKTDLREAAFHKLMLSPGTRFADADAEVRKRTDAELRALLDGSLDAKPDGKLLRRARELISKGSFSEAEQLLASVASPAPAVLALHAALFRRLGDVEQASAKANAADEHTRDEGVLLDVACVRAWVALRRDDRKLLERTIEIALRLVEQRRLKAIDKLSILVDLAACGAGTRHEHQLRLEVGECFDDAKDEDMRADRRLLLGAAAISGKRDHLLRALRFDALPDIDDVPRAALHAVIYVPFAALRTQQGAKVVDGFGLTDPPVRTARVVKSLHGLLQKPWPEAADLVRRVVAEARRASDSFLEARATDRAKSIRDLGAWVEVSVPPFMRKEMAQKLGSKIANAYDRGSQSGDGLVVACDRGRAILGLFQQLAEIDRPIDELQTLLWLRRSIAVPPAFEHVPHDVLLNRWRLMLTGNIDVSRRLDAWGLSWITEWSARPAVQLAEAMEVLNQRREAELPAELTEPPATLLQASAPAQWQPTSADPFAEVSLDQGRVFLDRAELRSALLRLTSATGATILLIDGKQGSGKSASIDLIRFAVPRRGFGIRTYAGIDSHPSFEVLARELLAAAHGPTTQLPIAGETTEEKRIQMVARLVARAFGGDRQTLLVFDDCSRARPDVQTFLMMLAAEIDAEQGETMRIVLIDPPEVIHPKVARAALRDTARPFTTDDMVHAVMQVANARGWSIPETDIRSAVEATSGQSLRDRAKFLVKYIAALVTAPASDSAKLVARFSLDARGRPQREKLTKRTVTHFHVILQLEGGSAAIRRVVYKLHETFEQRIRRVSSPPRFLEEIWTWGDFDVQATVTTAANNEMKLARSLVDMLRDGHRLDMNPEIEKAIDVLRKHA